MEEEKKKVGPNLVCDYKEETKYQKGKKGAG